MEWREIYIRLFPVIYFYFFFFEGGLGGGDWEPFKGLLHASGTGGVP